uniref:Uncharacterized protein n=3 Tax=Oryza sativa subsp. japonica TaxID=39947 RepID=Q75G78_ORYSJ|nr:unknown protein [Oryza sativa Japonica Group]
MLILLKKINACSEQQPEPTGPEPNPLSLFISSLSLILSSLSLVTSLSSLSLSLHLSPPHNGGGLVEADRRQKGRPQQWEGRRRQRPPLRSIQREGRWRWSDGLGFAAAPSPMPDLAGREVAAPPSRPLHPAGGDAAAARQLWRRRPLCQIWPEGMRWRLATGGVAAREESRPSSSTSGDGGFPRQRSSSGDGGGGGDGS